MTQDELQKIIEQLEGQISKGNATFGIFQYGGGSDENYIQANKEGLQLFALELLKVSDKANETLDDKEEDIIPIVFEESWIDEQSDTMIQYVQPVSKRSTAKDESKYKETIVGKLLPYGCLAGLIIIIIAVIIGLQTLIKWIF